MNPTSASDVGHHAEMVELQQAAGRYHRALTGRTLLLMENPAASEELRLRQVHCQELKDHLVNQLSRSSDVNVASMLLDKLKKRQKLFELIQKGENQASLSALVSLSHDERR